MAAVDDGAAVHVRVNAPIRKRAASSIGFCVADKPTASTSGRERLQSFQRQRQCAALIAGKRVDLIDDHRPAGGQHGPARLRAQQDVQRLRVVTTMCGGLRRIPARSDCDVSPLRTAARMATSAGSGPPALRECRERRLEIALMSFDSAFRGDT